MRAMSVTLILSIASLIGGAFVAYPLPAAAAAAAPAETMPPDSAEAFIRRGLELRRAGDDRGALPEFEKAYRLARTPRSAAQLGLVEQALGRWNDAELHLAEAVRASDDPWIEKNRVSLRQALVRVGDHVGSVQVTGEPAGAEVYVNGSPVGKLPLGEAVRVIAGTVDIEVRASGYRRYTQKVSVVAHQYTPLVIRLEELVAGDTSPAGRAVDSGASVPGKPATNSAVPAATVTATAPTAGVADERSGANTPRRSIRPTIGWTLAGVGAATAAAGVLVALAGQSKMDQAIGDAGRANQADDRGLYLNASERFSSGTSERTVGRVLLITGAVAAACGLVVALTTPQSGLETPAPERTTSPLSALQGIGPWMGTSNGQLALGAAFAATLP
jgi:hypothetical protein